MYSIKRFSQMTEQKEFGAVKAANKAAKKAWEMSTNVAKQWGRKGQRISNAPRQMTSSTYLKDTGANPLHTKITAKGIMGNNAESFESLKKNKFYD